MNCLQKGIGADAGAAPSYKMKLALVREVRLTFGVRAARRLWVELDLPDVAEDRPRDGSGQALDQFRRFLDAHTMRDMSAEVSARELMQCYDRWRQSAGAPKISRTMLGHLARKCELPRRKAGSTIYVGIRLRGRL